jgi:hypothetical protein
LHELLPAATTIALFVDPSNAGEAAAEIKEITWATNIVGMHLVVARASTRNELDPVPVTDVCGNKVCLDFFVIEDDPVAAVNQDEPTVGLILDLEVDDPDLFDQAVLPDVFAKLLQPRLGHVGNNSQAG